MANAASSRARATYLQEGMDPAKERGVETCNACLNAAFGSSVGRDDPLCSKNPVAGRRLAGIRAATASG
jgi:hypothetical protein